MSCAGPATQLPVWQRPGFGGAVRPEMGAPQPGEAAPEFSLPADTGGELRLSALRGQWVVLHFTASWCPYCDSEIEHLGQLADAFAPRGVRVVLLDVEESRAAWTNYARTHVAPSLLSAADETGRVARSFAPEHAQPSFSDRAQAVLDATLIVDPSGKIQLFLLPDTAHFDPTFRALRAELARLTDASGRAPLLSPEHVVNVGFVAAECGVRVSLNVAPGYHIMSDHPSQPAFIATSVTLRSDDLLLAAAVYPKAVPYSFAEQTIATFRGQNEVLVPCSPGANPPAGGATISATLRYQACTDTACLFPVTRHFSERIQFNSKTAEFQQPTTGTRP
jgi:thioredoxin-dependent peroxiredoxin